MNIAHQIMTWMFGTEDDKLLTRLANSDMIETERLIARAFPSGLMPGETQSPKGVSLYKRFVPEDKADSRALRDEVVEKENQGASHPDISYLCLTDSTRVGKHYFVNEQREKVRMLGRLVVSPSGIECWDDLYLVQAVRLANEPMRNKFVYERMKQQKDNCRGAESFFVEGDFDPVFKYALERKIAGANNKPVRTQSNNLIVQDTLALNRTKKKEGNEKHSPLERIEEIIHDKGYVPFNI